MMEWGKSGIAAWCVHDDHEANRHTAEHIQGGKTLAEGS
jgi:hypothetical protein